MNLSWNEKAKKTRCKPVNAKNSSLRKRIKSMSCSVQKKILIKEIWEKLSI